MSDTDKAKSVLVTGGGRGIGEAIVSALVGAGYDVTFTYRSAADEATALVKDLSSAHPARAITALQVDFSQREQVEALAEQLAKWPALYGFVHNAGSSADALAALLDQDRAETIMQINFWSMTRLIKAAIRPMMRARTGRIISIGSITSDHGAQGNAVYAASKGAMTSYMKTLAIEVARKGVTANIIAPGYVDTAMLEAYGDYRAKVEAQIPIGRYIQPQEIAGLARYLLSDDAGAITGTTIPVDGGLTAAVGINNKS